jgi:hypothetical protein
MLKPIGLLVAPGNLGSKNKVIMQIHILMVFLLVICFSLRVAIAEDPADVSPEDKAIAPPPLWTHTGGFPGTLPPS